MSSSSATPRGGLIAHTNQIGETNFFAYDAASRKTFETGGSAIRTLINQAGKHAAVPSFSSSTS